MSFAPTALASSVNAIGTPAVRLRDYQEIFVDEVRLEFKSGTKSVLLVAATGAGKTVVFSYIAGSAARLGKRTLILAHRDTLIKQASRKLTENGVQHGIIMAGFTPQPRRGVQVASVQTIVRRLKQMLEREQAVENTAIAQALAAGKTEAQAKAAGLAARRAISFDLIVIDEAHLSAAKSYMDVVAAFPHARILGVTGSPTRLDGKGLGRASGGLFDKMVQGITIKELIAQGYLVKPVVFASKQTIDFSSVKKVGGEYDSDDMAAVMDKPVITGSAIAEYQRICPGVPAVAWCANVAHAQHVAEQFNEAGIPALALSGENSGTERDDALKALSNGKIKVITFAMLLVEGVDCPAIGAVILLRLTMSLPGYLQTVGRGLRTIYAPGMPVDTVEQRFAAIDAGPKGRRLFVIDHCGLWQRHGFADADREWDLAGKPKGKAAKKDDDAVAAKQCEECHAVFEKWEWALATERHVPPVTGGVICPECGHFHKMKRGNGAEVVDGILVEITPEMEAAHAEQKRKQVKAAGTLEELQKIAAERGYKPGWAQNTFDAKQRTRAKYVRPLPEPPPWLNQ